MLVLVESRTDEHTIIYTSYYFMISDRDQSHSGPVRQHKMNINNEQPARPLNEAISECSRELKVRERCYARWVSEGKLTDVDAQDRYDRMASAIAWMERYQDAVDAQTEFEGPRKDTSESKV